MNNLKSFLFFIIAVLVVYGGTNFYVYRRIVQAASLSGPAAVALKFAILLAVAAYPLSRSPIWPKPIEIGLTWMGGFWLAVMVYSLMLALVLDLASLSDLLTGWFPKWLLADRVQVGRIVFYAGAGIIGLVLLFGRLSALHPVTKTVELNINRLPTAKNGYRVVMFSDVHLGDLVGEAWLERLVNQVNGLNADLILIPGDLIDENPDRLGWAEEPLKRLKAKDGVIFTTGNHEYYAGVVKAIRMMERCGMKVLRDQTLTIPGTVVVAGFDDITGSRQFKQPLTPIATLVKDCDPALPLILMHHTPMRYKEAQEAGVDLMVSGHAHGGQLWPFDYITNAVYGVKRGLTKIGQLNFFLSVGAGTWGPPIRVGATPEVVLFVLRF